MSAPPERQGPAPGDVLRGILGPLDGARIPGGCDCCNAYQTVQPIAAGIWSITVLHDDDCPWLAAHSGEGS